MPDFLDEPQQLLYRRAHGLFHSITSYPPGLDFLYPDPLTGPPTTWGDRETQDYMETASGTPYYRALGRYKTWDDFEVLALSLFTPEYFAELNGDPPMYMDKDGLLYINDGARGDNIERTGDPETFKLVSRTADRIEFNVVGYYWDSRKYSGDDWNDLSYTGSWDCTQEFPLVLENTSQGWRFSQYNIAD